MLGNSLVGDKIESRIIVRCQWRYALNVSNFSNMFSRKLYHFFRSLTGKKPLPVHTLTHTHTHTVHTPQTHTNTYIHTDPLRSYISYIVMYVIIPYIYFRWEWQLLRMCWDHIPRSVVRHVFLSCQWHIRHDRRIVTSFMSDIKKQLNSRVYLRFLSLYLRTRKWQGPLPLTGSVMGGSCLANRLEGKRRLGGGYMRRYRARSGDKWRGRRREQLGERWRGWGRGKGRGNGREGERKRNRVQYR